MELEGGFFEEKTMCTMMWAARECEDPLVFRGGQAAGLGRTVISKLILKQNLSVNAFMEAQCVNSMTAEVL